MKKKVNNLFIFEKNVKIRTDIEKLFEFHLDTNNLPKISPPFPKAEVFYMSDSPLKLNSSVTIRLSFLLFSDFWNIRIKEIDEPRFIVDHQEEGFFKYWYHSHIFERDNDLTVMTDKVEFIPPFGWFGKLMLPFIYLQLRIMFNYRHKKTKEIFEN